MDKDTLQIALLEHIAYALTILVVQNKDIKSSVYQPVADNYSKVVQDIKLWRSLSNK